MKQVYKCDFCTECFSSEQEAKQHEEKCPCNPKNKIEDKTVFRLAMVLYQFTDILATALTNHNEEKISFVLSEFERALAEMQIESLFGEGAEEYGFEPLGEGVDNVISILKAIASDVAYGRIRGATLHLRGNGKATIAANSKGFIKVQRSITRSQQLGG